jgi:hypothetical protein
LAAIQVGSLEIVAPPEVEGSYATHLALAEMEDWMLPPYRGLYPTAHVGDDIRLWGLAIRDHRWRSEVPGEVKRAGRPVERSPLTRRALVAVSARARAPPSDCGGSSRAEA